MNPRATLLAFLATLAVCGTAEAQPTQTLRPGQNATWSAEKQPSGAVFRSGDVTLTFRNDPDPDMSDLARPALTVAISGYAPVTLHGESTQASYEHQASVGRWAPDGRPFVYFQSFSGGAHCCTSAQVVYPEGGTLRIVDLGERDGAYDDIVPYDENGDGLVDFVEVDDGFLYAFASYAGSVAPPVIRNVVDGRVVDVSTNPAFRSHFERAAREARETCLDPEAFDRNGACAGWVAAAARLGRFDEAWTEMLRHYDRDARWDWPTGCRVTPTAGVCPEDKTITYPDFPTALRAFLEEAGYIPHRR